MKRARRQIVAQYERNIAADYLRLWSVKLTDRAQVGLLRNLAYAIERGLHRPAVGRAVVVGEMPWWLGMLYP